MCAYAYAYACSIVLLLFPVWLPQNSNRVLFFRFNFIFYCGVALVPVRARICAIDRSIDLCVYVCVFVRCLYACMVGIEIVCFLCMLVFAVFCYHIAPHRIVLHCIALHCIVLYCIARVTSASTSTLTLTSTNTSTFAFIVSPLKR